MDNNIFDFATKELSQDAVISWILNWINYPESGFYKLGINMLKLLSKFNGELDSLDSMDTEKNKKVLIKQQVENADIVVVYKPKDGAKQILIIEDKVDTSEHDNQIEKYKRKIGTKDIQIKHGLIKKEDENIMDIKTVYFKTGFFFDSDEKTKEKVNKTIMIDDVINLLDNHKDLNNEILDYYRNYIKNKKKIIDKYSTGWKKKENEYYLEKSEISQYEFLKEIFEENYYINNGSSKGKPWSDVKILPEETRAVNEGKLVWRLDKYNKGMVLSLAFYEEYNKKSDEEINNHRNRRDEYINRCKTIIKKLELNKELQKENDYYLYRLMNFPVEEYYTDQKEYKKNIMDITKEIKSLCNEKGTP